MTQEQFDKMRAAAQGAVMYRDYADIPDWGKPTVKRLVDKGALQGDGAWFAFTTGELWLLAGIRKKKSKETRRTQIMTIDRTAILTALIALPGAVLTGIAAPYLKSKTALAQREAVLSMVSVVARGGAPSPD